MNNIITIKISKDFSNTPKGRYHPKDGNFTGEKFIQEHIIPIFNKYDKIIIDLDDLYGCPSSFREESFGGLARKYGIDEVLEKLEFICTDEPPLIDVIIKDIKTAIDFNYKVDLSMFTYRLDSIILVLGNLLVAIYIASVLNTKGKKNE